MSRPSSGIPPKVLHGMPPYQLSADLVQATLAALPPPPPDASPAWRRARIARLIEEIAARNPTDAAQARMASQLVIVRELANTLISRAHAPGVTSAQSCSLAATADAVMRSWVSLARSLADRQRKPAPFFGPVVQMKVDIAALDAGW